MQGRRRFSGRSVLVNTRRPEKQAGRCSGGPQQAAAGFVCIVTAKDPLDIVGRAFAPPSAKSTRPSAPSVPVLDSRRAIDSFRGMPSTFSSLPRPWSIASALAAVCAMPASAADPPAASTPTVVVESARPKAFPHRIWAACDFEGQTPDYGWFGKPERKNIPEYPGNATALRAEPGPYQNFSAVMTGINPVPGPRMGKVNHLCVRYHLTGGDSATFQHFSLTREDNWHVRSTGLPTGRWTDATMNFTRDARRNDGSTEPFAEGERMDDFKLFAGTPAEAGRYQLLIDDVIFFATDPALPVEPEPFPNRIIYLAAFDTGEKEKYWPGEFELAEKPPAGAFWRAARAIAQADGKGKWIRLEITPPRPVGATTKLRFRYHLTGATTMTVQIFDATAQDNRHVNLKDLKTNAWTTQYVNFSRDSRRNDSTSPSLFAAGNKVDDLFFFVPSAKPEAVELFVDEVTLFDAGPTG
jgi:hypothetical protein